MKVMVHPNRHKVKAGVECCVSVTYRSHPANAGGQLTIYQGAVWMKDVEMRVQPAGVARAQREQQRNVHAWAVGEVTNMFHTQFPYPPTIDGVSDNDWRKVTYHFSSGEFRMHDTGENVTGRVFPYAYIVGRDFHVLDNVPTN